MKESLLFVVIAVANTHLSGVTPDFGRQNKDRRRAVASVVCRSVSLLSWSRKGHQAGSEPRATLWASSSWNPLRSPAGDRVFAVWECELCDVTAVVAEEH